MHITTFGVMPTVTVSTVGHSTTGCFSGWWDAYDAILINQCRHHRTRNVLDCDQSNYSSRIIFSYTFNLEPNTNWIGWTVSEIWPFKIIQDVWRPRSSIWSKRKWRQPRKPCRRIKREVDRMIRCRDMAVRNFPKCEVGRSVGRSVGRWSSILHCSHILLYATLGTWRARSNKKPSCC